MSKHVIELNGKRYDAVSGALLGSGAAQPTHVAAKRAAGARQGRNIDGIVSHKPKQTSTVAAVPAPPKTLPKKPAVSRQPSPTLAAHQPQRPQTLMRRVVKKPQIPTKPAIKTQAPAEIMAKPASSIVRKVSIDQVNPKRLARAKDVTQSGRIARFNTTAGDPTPQRDRNQFQPVNRGSRGTHYTTLPPRSHSQPPKAQAIPTQAANAQPQPTHTDVFEAALAHATSHQHAAPHHRRRRHRLTNFTAGIAVFLVIGGFVTYLNFHSIEMRFASVRAGFNAQLPDYKPTGYALKGPIKSESGRVSFSFRSGERYFTVTQQASNWNSQTLLDNTVFAKSGAHQTIQSKGRTIYVYKNNRASWVNGGVRYDISGNADLNPSDIASIASSM